MASKRLQNKLGRNYPGSFAAQQDIVSEICAAHGIRRIITAGRSGGGLGAMAFSADYTSRNISIAGVYAAEMAGCGIAGENTPAERKHAKRAYFAYRDRQKELHEQNPSITRGTPQNLGPLGTLSRLASMGICNFNDFYNNDQVWGSSIGIDCAETVARELPDTYLQLDFASISAVASQDTIDNLANRLSAERPCGPTTAGIRVEQLYNTTHASFDNRDLFAHRLLYAVNHTLFS